MLNEAQGKMISLMKDMAEVSAKLESFTKSVSDLWDHNSVRYKNTIKDIRLKAYGGSSACVVFPPSCAFVYPTAAAIIETKIKKLNRAASVLENTCKEAQKNAKALQEKIEDSNLQSEKELEIIKEWEGFANDANENVKDLLDWIQIGMIDEVVRTLDGLEKTCQAYLVATEK